MPGATAAVLGARMLTTRGRSYSEVEAAVYVRKPTMPSLQLAVHARSPHAVGLQEVALEGLEHRGGGRHKALAGDGHGDGRERRKLLLHIRIDTRNQAKRLRVWKEEAQTGNLVQFCH